MQITAALRDTTSAVSLVPVENNSINVPAVPRLHRPGEHRAAFLAAATSGEWGNSWNTCGKAVLTKQEGDITRVVPVLCDTWACVYCGPRRASWLRRNLASAVKDYELHNFVTLTLRTSDTTPAGSFTKITDAWNIVATNIRRDRGAFSYVRVVEPTKAGFAHFHVLTNWSVDTSELARRWKLATDGSFIVDQQSSDSDRAANYISKYCTQQARIRREPGYEHLRGRRLFTKSQDVKFTPFRSASAEAGASPWVMQQTPFWDYRNFMWKRGRLLSEVTRGSVSLTVRS